MALTWFSARKENLEYCSISARHCTDVYLWSKEGKVRSE